MEKLKEKFLKWCKENKDKVWLYRPQLMTAERAVNVSDILRFFNSLPVEAQVILPSQEEAKQQAEKVYGSDGEYKFRQMADDNYDKNRPLAEAFLHGCHYMRYMARSK